MITIMNIRNHIIGAAAIAIALSACSDNALDLEYGPEPPLPEGNNAEVVIKPKAIWIDVHANFERLSKKVSIDVELDKIKKCGFNTIYLDVKPGNGYALYKSDILPYCNTFGNLTVTRDYDDYLGYFIEKCEELDIDVIASVGGSGFGSISGTDDNPVRQGFVYDDPDKWRDICQMRNIVGNADEQLVNIMDEPPSHQASAMLSPAAPEAQDLLLDILTEIVEKYPKIKGICLDYTRYADGAGGYFGMGPVDMQGYARYWNESEPKPSEIITLSGGIGPKYAKWNEYKAATVCGLITRIRQRVKSINPDCELHLWASAHWESRYSTGQNWASKRYIPSGAYWTDTYNTTGFADQLDVFVTGAYASNVWIKDDPSTVWSVEHFCTTWNNYIMGDCKCYGSISIAGYDAIKTAEATFLCLKKTDGFMSFELSHMNNANLWESTRQGILRYEDPSQVTVDPDPLY